MNVFESTPCQVIAYLMTEIRPAKQARMVFVDGQGNLEVVRADTTNAQQHLARHPEHWVGTWSQGVKRQAVAFQVFTRMAALVQNPKPTPTRNRAAFIPDDPFVSGATPKGQGTLQLVAA